MVPQLQSRPKVLREIPLIPTNYIMWMKQIRLHKNLRHKNAPCLFCQTVHLMAFFQTQVSPLLMRQINTLTLSQLILNISYRLKKISYPLQSMLSIFPIDLQARILRIALDNMDFFKFMIINLVQISVIARLMRLPN